MAAFIFNVAKGRMAELFLGSAGGQVVLLEAAEPNNVLRGYDTLVDLLAAPGNTELAHASYARKAAIAATVIIDDALDELRVELPPITWVGLQGNPVVKALICFDKNGIVIPLTCHDWPLVPDGSDATLMSFFRARGIDTIQQAIGLALEVGSPFGVGKAKRKAIGQPVEADTALSATAQSNGGSSSALATLAASMNVGEWAQLTGVGNIGALTDSYPGGAGHVLPYSERLAWDPITRRAYFLNSDDPGDGRHFVAYDEATNAWVLLSNQGVWPAAGSIAPPQPQYRNHIYCQLSIDVENRRLWWGNGTVSGGIGYYDLATNTFATNQEGSWSPEGNDDAPALEYFPDRDAVYYIRGDDIFERRNATGIWTTLSSAINVSFHVVAHYNAFHRCMVIGGGNETPNNLYRLNVDGTIAALGNPPVGIDVVRTTWVENPATGDFFVLFANNGSTAFWTFNPATDTWSNQGTAGVPSAIFAQQPYLVNQIMTIAGLIPEYNVMLFVSRGVIGSQTHWLYRYA